jgi:F-type H+-transporting ATPase subunit b
MHEETVAHSGPREFALFQYDPGVGIWAVITFVLLLLILKKFAWKPLMDSIDARDAKIRESLDTAKQLQESNAKQTEEQHRILVKTREEAAGILADARKSAEDLKLQILGSAQVEKESILKAATEEIEVLTHKAKSELRNFSADLAMGAAEKILRTNLDSSTSKKLVDQYIQEMEA